MNLKSCQQSFERLKFLQHPTSKETIAVILNANAEQLDLIKQDVRHFLKSSEGGDGQCIPFMKDILQAVKSRMEIVPINNNNAMVSYSAAAVTTTTTSKVLEERVIPEDLRRLIDQVTIQSSVQPVGTFKYRVFKYPSDIDLFEKIVSDDHLPLFINNLVERIKTIVQSIMLSDNIFFLEMKAGEDQRFNLEDPSSITEISSKLDEWQKNDLVTKEEATSLKKLIEHYMANSSDVIKESIMDQVRSFRVLRWNIKEIIIGRKQLRGGQGKLFMTLYDALQMPVITKIDTLIWYDNRYIEMTNYFYFEANGQVISKPFEDYMMALYKDIKKYGGCEKNGDINYLKMLKRMFIKSALDYKISQNPDILIKMESYVKIINDSPGALSQIKADFEALESVLKSKSAYNIKNICIMLNSMTKRFNNNINLVLTRDFNKTKDELFGIYYEYQNNDDQQIHKFNDHITQFIKTWIPKLNDIINTETYDLIKANKIELLC